MPHFLSVFAKMHHSEICKKHYIQQTNVNTLFVTWKAAVSIIKLQFTKENNKDKLTNKKATQTYKQASKQTNKQTNKNKQTKLNEQTNGRTNKRVNENSNKRRNE